MHKDLDKHIFLCEKPTYLLRGQVEGQGHALVKEQSEVVHSSVLVSRQGKEAPSSTSGPVEPIYRLDEWTVDVQTEQIHWHLLPFCPVQLNQAPLNSAIKTKVAITHPARFTMLNLSI